MSSSNFRSVKKRTVGLVRHRATEPAQESVLTLFGTIEDLLSRHFELRLLPSYAHELNSEPRAALLRDFLQGSEVIVSDLGPAVLTARNREQADLPVIALGLGSITKGDRGVRSSFPLLASCDTVLLNCHSDVASYHDFAASCRAAVRLVPLGVDTRTFSPASIGQRRQLRQRLGFADTDIVFLYAGRIASDKNVHSILTLLAPLMEQDVRIRLLIVGRYAEELSPSFWVGPNDIHQIIRQVLAGLPILKERTTFLPALMHQELAEVHHAADCFICLTLAPGENFGYAQVEAMSSGLPVVATDWCGLKDTIAHGETGYKVDTLLTERGVRLDAWQAQSYCTRLACQPDLRRRMGAAARRRAESLYSLDELERGLLSTVEDCLQRQRPQRASANRLTPFGARLDQTFRDKPQPGDPHGGARWASFARQRDYPLYRTLIGRSCTGPVSLAPNEESTLWLTPLSWELRGEALDIRDPIHPATLHTSRAQRAVLRAFARAAGATDSSFLGYPTLLRAVPQRLSRQAFDRALGSLIRRGVIGHSRFTEDASRG